MRRPRLTIVLLIANLAVVVALVVTIYLATRPQ